MNYQKRPERILEGAKAELLSKGFADASMRTLAGKIVITAKEPYRHFQDKV